MQPVSTGARQYDARTIALHWATAGLIAAQWGIAQVIDWFPNGTPRVAVRSTHIVLGLALVAVLLTRVAWRATSGRRLPAADSGALHIVAKATHWTMYGLLAAVLALGMVTAWARGDSIFGLFRLPKLDPSNPDLGEYMVGVHGTAVTVLLVLAAVHAGAALMHHYFWKDGVLRRMLPNQAP